MITSTSYYIGNIQVPGVQTAEIPNTDRIGKQSVLNNFIDEYEVDYLSKSLGFTNYDAFSKELEVKENETLQTIKESAPQKWKDLLNGKTYIKDGLTVRYRGLIYSENGIPKSPMAYYVFSKFFEHDMSHYGNIGLQIEKAKNSERANYAPKLILANQKHYNLTVGDKDDPKESAGYRSLYQFIQDMNDIDSSTYPNWSPYKFPQRNIMGL